MTYKEYLKSSPHRRFDFSFSEEVLSGIFQKTICNKNSRGSDGMSAQKFEECLDSHIEIMSRKVFSGSYKFSPYVELLSVDDASSFVCPAMSAPRSSATKLEASSTLETFVAAANDPAHLDSSAFVSIRCAKKAWQS